MEVDAETPRREKTKRENGDEPPNSRLFVVCDKSVNEAEISEAFVEHGDVEDVKLIVDRLTGESKGVAFVKFAKTSQAISALEKLNGSSLVNHARPIKVMVASNRTDGNKRDTNVMERLCRLHILVPKDVDKALLHDHFGQFGDVDDVSVVKDRKTGCGKGFAFVRYRRASHAALAFENCDKSYKPKFADPKPLLLSGHAEVPDHHLGSSGRHSGPGGGTSSRRDEDASFFAFNKSFFDSDWTTPAGCDSTSLHVVAAAGITPHQLWKLFDIIPGLVSCDVSARNCDFDDDPVFATVKYRSPKATSWALSKLHNLEYPPGSFLKIRSGAEDVAPSPTKRPLMQEPTADALARAHSALRAAGLAIPEGDVDLARLPPPQPLAPPDAAVQERLFVVCTPSVLPRHVLVDLFRRFEGLIEVYMMSGRTCGFVKYAVARSARRAVECLHGREVSGVHLKVMFAEPKHGEPKRLKAN